MLKKLLAGALSVAMLFGMASVLPEEITEKFDTAITASAESAPSSGKCGENVSWSLSDGVLTISGTGDMYDWVNWDDSPLSADSRVYSIKIEKGVTSIGKNAFCYCKSLESITMPDSVTRIGQNAFFNCKKLYSIKLSDGLSIIDEGVFSYCTSLTSITIPSSVESILDNAFSYCPDFTIYCYSKSAAEQYAIDNDYDYVILDAKEISECTVINNLAEVFYTGTPRIIDNYIVVKDGEKTLKKGTDYTTSYSNNVNMGLNTAKVTINGTGAYTGSKTISFTIKPKTQAKPTVTSTGLNMRIQWTKDTTVTGYQIAYDTTASCDSNDVKYIYVTNITNYARTITGLPAGKTYYAKVRAYKTVNGKNVYGKWSAISKAVTVKPGALAVSSLTSTVATKAVVRWGTVPAGSTGVQIQYALNDELTDAKLTAVTNTKTLYKTLINLTSGTTYYVRIRTYVSVDGNNTYGSWSAVKSVKAK